jgi:hypothetical protein
MEWKRASDYDSEATVFGHMGVRPAGINQHRLGDCWFLAAAGALAETPSRLKALFNLEHEDNSYYPANGAFKLNFHNRHGKVPVVVDD